MATKKFIQSPPFNGYFFSCYSNRCMIVLLILVFGCVCLTFCESQQWYDRQSRDFSRNGFDLSNIDPSTKRKMGGGFLNRNMMDEQGYLTDDSQNDVNPADIGGIIIHQEAKRLSDRLQWLSKNEIGTHNMQVS